MEKIDLHGYVICANTVFSFKTIEGGTNFVKLKRDGGLRSAAHLSIEVDFGDLTEIVLGWGGG